jgi:hypothetical protein
MTVELLGTVISLMTGNGTLQTRLCLVLPGLLCCPFGAFYFGAFGTSGSLLLLFTGKIKFGSSVSLPGSVLPQKLGKSFYDKRQKVLHLCLPTGRWHSLLYW